MATERFNRQFVLIDFEDLDNPEYLAFMRAPEFSTYMVMRRHIWRSKQEHSMGLHSYHARGYLTCALNREKIAESLAGISPRQVTRDFAALLKRGIVETIATGRGNIFVLGRWATAPEKGIYYEYFFLDALLGRVDKNVQSAPAVNTNGQNCPPSLDENVQAARTLSSTINREENKEENRESSNIPSSTSSTSTGKLNSSVVELRIETCSREFGDLEHLGSNFTRTYNLWAKTDLDEEAMLEKVQEARDLTKKRISSSQIKDRGKKMAYFFAVLEDLLGLKAPAK
jgi:hypothetical protein